MITNSQSKEIHFFHFVVDILTYHPFNLLHYIIALWKNNGKPVVEIVNINQSFKSFFSYIQIEIFMVNWTDNDVDGSSDENNMWFFTWMLECESRG